MPKLSIADRKAHLQAQLAEIEAQENEERTAKLAVVGRVVMDAMDNDENVATQMRTLLDKGLRKKAEREMFDLPVIPSKRGRPAAS